MKIQNAKLGMRVFPCAALLRKSGWYRSEIEKLIFASPAQIIEVNLTSCKVQFKNGDTLYLLESLIPDE